MRRWMMFVVCVAVAGLSVWGGAGEARACSLAPTGWNAYNPETTVTGVPVEGVVVIQAVMYNNGIEGLTQERGLEAVTVTVTDASGTEVPGSVSLGGVGFASTVIWRADAPFATGATYTLEAVFDNASLDAEFGDSSGFFEQNITVTLSLEAADSETPAPSAPTQVGAELTQWVESTGSVCCPVGPEECLGACGPPDTCERCFAEGYVYQPRLDVELDAQTPASLVPYTYYTVYRGTNGVADTEDTTYSAGEWSPLSVITRFQAESESYCVKVEKRTLLDERTAESEVICVDHSELQPTDRIEPDYSTLAVCTELPEGYDRNGPIDGSASEDCGCSTLRGSSGSSSPVLPLALGLALLMVPWVRRRGA